MPEANSQDSSFPNKKHSHSSVAGTDGAQRVHPRCPHFLFMSGRVQGINTVAAEPDSAPASSTLWLSLRFSLCALAGLLGCPKTSESTTDVGIADATNQTTSSADPTASTIETSSSAQTNDSNSGVPTSSESTSDVSGATSCEGLACRPDLPPSGKECKTWNDSCPVGQKCVAYSEGNNCYMDSTHCVEVSPVPAGLYEPCSVGLDYCATGVDNCAKGMQCFEIDIVSRMGECYARCAGGEFPTDCDLPQTSCASDEAQTITICQPSCSPLTPEDCVFGTSCNPDEAPPNTFECRPDMSEGNGEAFSICNAGNTCAPGNACVPSEFSIECDANSPRCCLPFCDLDEPNVCPGLMQVCSPWFDPQLPLPSMLTQLGVCSLPE